MAPEALMAGVHASIQAMENRMEQALTEQASALAKAIENLNVGKIPAQQRTFAQETRTEPAQGNTHPQGRPPKQDRTQQNTPPPNSSSRAHPHPGGRAEIDNEANALAARINFAMEEVRTPDPPSIRALRWAHRRYEIVLKFNNVEHAKQAEEESGEWLPLFDPELKVKVKL